jgi:hypothetical protein
MSKNNGRLRACPANIRLVRKGLAVANALAYYDTATIMAIKSFIVFLSGSGCLRIMVCSQPFPQN